LHRKKLACRPAEQQRRGVSLRRPPWHHSAHCARQPNFSVSSSPFAPIGIHSSDRLQIPIPVGHPWRRLQLDKSPHPPSGERDGTRQMCFHFLPRYVQTSLSATDGSRRS
jgi:hypothetical protein